MHSRLVNSRTRQYFDHPPTIFLDGIHVTDPMHIKHLRSEDIDRIDVHNYPWRYGNVEFQGIISIKSTGNALAGLTGNGSYAIVSLPPMIFRSTIRQPAHNGNEKDSSPDFRQTLYWDPDIKFGASDSVTEFSFQTGDLTGRFIIRVVGITNSGNKFSEQAVIIVD